MILDKMPKIKDERVLVGFDTSDDSAVYKLTDDMALIQTLDFFTPVVDDPYAFGQIAAANALSDIYAMGGKPIIALNIVCFPTCLPVEVLGEILRGGADKAAEAGAIIVGGHSVEDNEPKYGLSVSGIVHPKRVLRNSGSESGEVLIITKPLGTGLINTAVKGDMASEEASRAAVETMSTLNKYAAEIIEKYPVSACTDITGFGLIGHAYEMAFASGVAFKLVKDNIPYIKEAQEYAKMGLVPAGAYNNKKYIEGKYDTSGVPEWLEDILFDPQTSGGLLFSCSKEAAREIIPELSLLQQKSAVIGEVVPAQDKFIIVE